MSLDPHECEYVLSPLPSRSECKVIAFPERRRAPDRPLPQQSFVVNHNAALAALRRARLVRVAKWTALWAALAVGLAVASVFVRAAVMTWWRAH